MQIGLWSDTSGCRGGSGPKDQRYRNGSRSGTYDDTKYDGERCIRECRGQVEWQAEFGIEYEFNVTVHPLYLFLDDPVSSQWTQCCAQANTVTSKRTCPVECCRDLEQCHTFPRVFLGASVDGRHSACVGCSSTVCNICWR
jgi:hypothetical protein